MRYIRKVVDYNRCGPAMCPQLLDIVREIDEAIIAFYDAILVAWFLRPIINASRRHICFLKIYHFWRRWQETRDPADGAALNQGTS